MTAHGLSLEVRLRRLEAAAASRAGRNSAADAFQAILTGAGTDADLEIIYAAQETTLRKLLLEEAVDRALGLLPLMFNDLSSDREWFSFILGRPTDDQNLDWYREGLALAERRSSPNPYEAMSQWRPKPTGDEIHERVNWWVVAKLMTMFIARNDEAALREEVVAMIPTDPRVRRQRMRDWRREYSSPKPSARDEMLADKAEAEAASSW